MLIPIFLSVSICFHPWFEFFSSLVRNPRLSLPHFARAILPSEHLSTQQISKYD